jgi:hypothetical protein
MTDRLETVVVVTDKGSQTFTKVGDSATKMGTSIDKAATQGSTSLGRLNKAGAAAGVAFASLSGVLTLAAHANAEAQASHERLATAIDNTGHSLFEYQDQLDAAAKKALQLGFDDEDAADSIAKMTTATGSAQTAINDLSIAEDIARARKIDLASATNIVIAAEQGRTGALKRVGIEVDATMSKEQVMDALRAKFAGNAEAYSTTTAAGYDRLKNSTENALEAIGAHLGPANQLLMILPGLNAGFIGVSGAVGALAPELTAASAASVALDLALGPVGLAAALAAAAAALVIYSSSSEDAFVSSKKSQGAIEDLTNSLNEQAASGANVAAAQKLNAEWQKISGTARQNQKDFDEVNQSIATIEAQGGRATDEMWADWNRLNGQFKLTDAQILSVTNSMGELFAHPGLDATKVTKTLEGYDKALQEGTINGTTFTNVIAGIAKNWYDYTTAGEKGTAATNAAAASTKEVINAFTGYRMGIKQLGDQYQELDGQIDSTTNKVTEFTNKLSGAGRGHKVLGQQFVAPDLDSVNAASSALADQTKAANDAAAANRDGAKAFLDQANAIGVLNSDLDKLIASDVSTWAERTSSRVQTATTRLDTLFSVIVDGTKNIGSQSQNLNDWAVGLVNVAGSYGKIDELLAHGQITLTTYNQAQEAGTRIIADNAAVQEDLLRIQAKQAPVLADAADAQAKYVDQLADMPAKQQEVALGWMDQNEATKANAALNLAAAAAAGEYGAAGEAAATAAITAQAQADPAFKAMLTDMGVISEGANGEIVVNFPTASQVHDDTVNLTASIDALTVALGGIPPYVSTTITADYSGLAAGVAGAQQMLNTIDGRTVTTYVTTQYLGQTLPGQLGYAIGGVIPHAQHGMMGDGRTVIVGEAGPEIVKLPGGSLVTPSGASKEMMRGGGGNITIHVHGDIVADDPRAFAQKAVSLAYAGSRG